MDSRIRFLMIGNGPERQRIRQLAVEKGLTNMVFADVPYEKTAELYSVAYASVATLRNIPVAKGMRLSKIFPSLSCGIPVIYSGIGEAGELLTRNACGIAVEPESPAALAGAIRLLANDQTMRDQLSRNGRAYVEHEFSWSTIVGRWLEALERASHSPTEASLSRASAWYPGEISDPAAESRLPASTE
jgi:glycosyltransferase involved in cell wall biosynthesis